MPGSVDIAVLGMLSLWLVLSIFYNIPRYKDALSRHDVLYLLPAWSFFAPRPGTNDIHWLFRDLLEDGTLTPWTELTLVEERWVGTVVLNPGKRELKALLDICGEISSPSLNRHGSKAVALSLGYLTLLNRLTSLQHAHTSLQTQFILMTSSGLPAADEPRAYFLSHFHELKTPAA